MACQYFYNGQSYSKEELLNLIQQEKVAEEQFPYLNYTQYDQEPLKVLFGIEDIESFLGEERIARIRQYNPSLKFSLNEDNNSNYNPSTNTINISLSEIYNFANKFNHNYGDTLDFFLEHEIGHAISTPALRIPENQVVFNQILNRVISLYKKKPFIDTFRGGVLINGLPYAFQNIDELATEAFNNPDVSNWLKSITNGQESLWDRIINFLRSIIGLNPINNIYRDIHDIVMSKEFMEGNEDIVMNFPEELQMSELFAADFIWEETIRNLYQIDETNGDISTIFKRLPQAASILRKALENAKNTKEAKNLKAAIDTLNKIENNKDNYKERIASGIALLNHVYSISLKLDADLRNVSKMENGSDKMQMLFMLQNQAKDMEMVREVITSLQKYLTDKSVTVFSAERFSNQINKIIEVQNKINDEVKIASKPSLISYLSLQHSHLDIAEKLRKDLEKIDNSLETEKNEFVRSRLLRNKERLIKEISLIPTSENLWKVVNGEMADASVMDLQLQALALNGHPLVQSLAQLLFEKDKELTYHRMKQESKMDNILKKFKKAIGNFPMRNLEQIMDKITVKVKRIKAIHNVNGKLVPDYVEQRMFLANHFSNKYLEDWDEIQAYINYYESEIQKLYRDRQSKPHIDNSKKLDDLYKAQDEWEKKRRDFKKEHSQREHKDSFYEVYDLLDEQLSYTDEEGNVTTTSLRKEHRELFNRMAIYESYKQAAITANEINDINDNLDEIWMQFKGLRSKWQDGVEKTGLQKALAEQATKYYEARRTIGERILTDENRIEYEKDVASVKEKHEYDIRNLNAKKDTLQKQFDEGKISLSEHDAKIKRLDWEIEEHEKQLPLALKKLQITTLTPEFYLIRDQLQNDINSLLEKVLKVDELVPYFDQSKTSILRKEGYDKIRDLSRPYRDNEAIVDGVAMYKNEPNSVRAVKEIQEGFVELDKSIEKIPKSLYKKHKSLISELYEKRKELSSMMESVESDYYLEEKANRINEIRNRLQKDILDNLDTILEENDIEKNEDGSYSQLERKKNKKGEVEVRSVKFAEDEVEVARILAERNLKEEFENSDWFKENHFLNKKNKWEPLYIWVERRPSEAKYINPPQPAPKYTTFKPFDNQLNEDYALATNGLGIPKKSSKYYIEDTTKDLDAAHKQLHKELLDFYFDTQSNSGMLDSERLFYIMPSVPKSDNENKIAIGNGILKGNAVEQVKNWVKEKVGAVDDDSAFIQEGSVDRTYIAKKEIPFRFNGKMDAVEQTANPFLALLLYDNINTDVVNRRVLKPIIETALAATDDLERKVDSRKTVKSKLAGAFNLSNVLKNIKNKGTEVKITKIKDGKSVLNDTIQHMLDTFVLGEIRTDAKFPIGGTELDGHKIGGGIKKLSSRMIFALKWFGPMKNQISSTINLFLNANMGFFEKQDVAWALGKAASYIPALLKDYKKVGNKSDFGTMMDYFQVVQGGISDVYGNKLQWSALTEVQDNLSVAKQAMELQGQITTFLSLSKANSVEINGKRVPFHEAFDIKDGVVTPKKGANITKRDIELFTNKIAYVNRRINGTFRALEKAKAQKGVFGSLAFYLNNFVMPGIAARYGKTEFHADIDMITRGYYRDGLEFSRDLILSGFKYRAIWNNLRPEEKQRIRHFAQEITAATLMALAVTLLALGGDDKDSLEENSAIHNYLLALSIGAASEVQTFIPIPLLGGDEIVRKIASPFAAARQVVVIGKILQDLFYTVGGTVSESMYDDARYQTQGVRDGLHDVGDLKLLANTIKLTGFNFKEFDSVEKVIQQKQAQQIR